MDIQNIISKLSDWAMVNGLHIVIILVVAYIAHKISGRFIEKIVRRLVTDGGDGEQAEKMREDTLIQIFNGTASIVIVAVAGITILSELGIEIGPLLAAAGIVGIALGFGGQYLIRDIITGIFLILENQYRVGDSVCFDTTCGTVERISLRKTQLRDLSGTVHHVPHGEIKRVSNLSMQFARVNMNIGVSYSSDIEKVIAVVNQIGKELASDPLWSEFIIKEPAFLRVESFEDSAIMVKILGETKPLKNLDVAGEFRKRLKIAFDREGIEIPFPQRVVHQAK